jgi:pre-mRNA-processing factor 39
MSQQEQRVADVRNIFRRACTLMVPISRPFIRFQWSIYEEYFGDRTLARDILQAMINDPQHQETVNAAIQRVHLERRVSPGNAIDFIDTELSKPGPVKDNLVKGVYAASKAVIQWRDFGNIDAARKVFENNKALFLNSQYFFINYFEFEASNTDSASTIHALWKYIVSKSKLPPSLIADISQAYMTWLEERGHMEKYIEVDVETYGPFSVQSLHQRKLGDDTLSRLRKEAWHPGVEIDKYDKKNPFTKYLQQQHGDSSM